MSRYFLIPAAALIVLVATSPDIGIILLVFGAITTTLWYMLDKLLGKKLG